ncbi:FtsX-like permease family protein [Clostridiaceae bacterium]|nr:FtsX-like permease family protein [Clostridiaceae bacterium]RKI15580.1 FtsX-like permease family protein [bacterium 1XD21-70]
MLIENMLMAFSAIRANKMRSFLTMLGIIIGIGSVISIVSIGDTMRGLFEELYRKIGITQAYIAIGYWVDDWRQSDYFTLDEMERIKEIFGDEIAYIDSDAFTSGDAVCARTTVKFNYQGIDYNYQEVQPVNMVYGRYLNEGDILGRRKNVVMDTTSAINLFGVENAVGKTFRTTIYGTMDEYTVVGVYKKDLNPFQAMMLGSNTDGGEAFVPYTILTWPNDYFYDIRIFAKDEESMDMFFDNLKAYVAKSKDRNPEDFRMETAKAQMGQWDSMMGGLATAVGGIAAISLLVGGIGIMNIMLVSVTERTREIGIRKSLGARTKDIMVQFLTESAILSACGGILGILLGGGIVTLGGRLLGVQAIVKPGVVVLAVGFSAMVGIFFGIYPASKAAKKDPIEALRYE